MSKNNKVVCITARCTEKEKEMIHKKAQKKNKSDSKYIIDSCMAEGERNAELKKRILVNQIKMQESLNQMKYILEEHRNSVSASLDEKIKNKISEMEEMIYAYFSGSGNVE